MEANIKLLDAVDNCKLYKMPALKFSMLKREYVYDLIFADPPFFKDDIYNVVENILSNKYLCAESIILIERSIQTKEKDIKHFKAEPFKIIGDACLYEITY